MATTKTSPKRVIKATPLKTQEVQARAFSMPQATVHLPVVNRDVSVKLLVIAAIVIIAVAVVGWANKGLLVAGTVDNRPIWRWELENKMVSRYGDQTMEEMINERLIANEAGKRNIVVTASEIDAKVAEIEKTLEGQVTLTDALSQQGMTLPEFKKQVALQLTVEKMTADINSVSDDEINAYLEKNKDILISTDEASLRANARETILRDKKNNAFREIFDSLKKQAKVMKFL